MNPGQHDKTIPQPSGPPSGLTHRLWIRLRRFILGRSDSAYTKQFTGNDVYWDNMLAAERGGPPSPVPTPDPRRKE